MRKIFKKVSAIAASALMVGLTVGTAAAANYPNPFVVGGAANVAIVYGTGSGVSSLDIIQAGNIQSNLQSYMTGSSGGDASISGEAAALFGSGSSQIYIDTALNSVKSGSMTKTNLPVLLADSSFSGNVDATISQTITLGSSPNITFAQQPASDDDPALGLEFSTTSGLYLYNATITFSKEVALNHSDSEGEEISLFGTTWTISASTDDDDLILLKSAEKVSLSSDSSTSDVTINGATYTIELISASDTAATVKVTNSAGASETKEIDEAKSKTVNGISVAVTNCDENNLKYSATIVAGDEEGKLKFNDGSSVKQGTSATSIKGTKVEFEGSTAGYTGTLTSITVSVVAPASDEDAILPGESFVDPVFGTFKVDFPGFNIDEDSTSREDIKFTTSGDDKMIVTFTDNRGYEKPIQYAYNGTDGSGMILSWDSAGKYDIIVSEMTPVNYSDYVVVGNEDDGRLVKVTEITNDTEGGFDDDVVEFEDVFSGDTYETSITAEGTGTVTIGGNDYTITYNLSDGETDYAKTIQINYPDSSSSGDMVIYPTISTSKGAKIMFYKPLVINVTEWDIYTDEGEVAKGLAGGGGTELANIKIPNGANSYQTLAVTHDSTSHNLTIGGQALTNENVAGFGNWTVINITNTGLCFNFTHNSTDQNETKVFLTEPDGNGNIVDPAIVILEEKDDSNTYEDLIIITEPGDTSTDGIGVDSIKRSWSDDAKWNEVALYSNTDKSKEADKWGTIATINSADDSDQKTATISYPDDQVYAMIYLASEATSITTSGATSATQLGDVLAKDSEISSVQSKNLIVVGGSCINSVAAKLVGQAACSADFTTKTGVGSGQFLIQSFGDAYTTGKIALLVAGYEAADTVNAATYLRTQTVDTTAGKKYKGTSATSAELVVE